MFESVYIPLDMEKKTDCVEWLVLNFYFLKDEHDPKTFNSYKKYQYYYNLSIDKLLE